MTAKKLSRTTYRDPTLPMSPIRPGDAARAECALDMDEYYRPLEQVHGSALHDFGVAQGLRIEATNGAPGVRVLPGIALDVAGHHISLADGGQAEVAVDPDAQSSLTAVAATGATVPTTGPAGDKILVISHRETFDAESWTLLGVFRFIHTPWLHFKPAAGFVDSGTDVVLGRVTVNASGNVTGLAPGPRHGVGTPVEKVRLRRANQAASFAIEETTYGEIRPLASGGIEVAVPKGTDALVFDRDGGGGMDKVAANAATFAFRRNDGDETVRIKTAGATIEAGLKETPGDVRLFDKQNEVAVRLDAAGALGEFGALENPGDVRVTRGLKDKLDGVRLLGQGGDVYFRGKLREFGNPYPGVGHAELKDLTDGGTTSLHKHDIGVLGRNGATGTRLGITSGWVEVLNAPANTNGSLTVTFEDWNASAAGAGYATHVMLGYKGKYAARPHVITAPQQMSLSTYSDTFFSIFYGVSGTSVTFHWRIDGAGDGYSTHQFQFMIVGPI
jgi:hypothetical protein